MKNIQILIFLLLMKFFKKKDKCVTEKNIIQNCNLQIIELDVKPFVILRLRYSSVKIGLVIETKRKPAALIDIIQFFY